MEMSARRVANPGEGIAASTVMLFSVACGAIVANLYYAQPLLGTIAHSLHVSSGVAGLIVTVTQGGYAAGLLLLVPLGDVRDRRLLVLGLLSVTVAALVGAAASPDLGLLALALLITGFTSVVAQVLVPFAATLARPEDRGRVVGRVMSGLVVGILLARTVSGALSQALGWRAVYLVAAGVIVALIVLLARQMPSSPPESDLAYPALLRSVVDLLRQYPALRFRCALGALGFFAFSVFWTTGAFLLSGAPYHYDVGVIGLFGLVGAAGALAAARAGRLADRGFAVSATRAFALAIPLSYGLIALGGHSLVALILGIILLDLGLQGLQVTNQSEIYRLAPEARSRVTTAYMTSFFLGGAAGSAAAAACYSAWGWPAVSGLGAGVGVLTVLLSAFAARCSATTPPVRSRHETSDQPEEDRTAASPR
jgi:predicted MFS family arabinose efflux permease